MILMAHVIGVPRRWWFWDKNYRQIKWKNPIYLSFWCVVNDMNLAGIGGKATVPNPKPQNFLNFFERPVVPLFSKICFYNFRKNFFQVLGSVHSPSCGWNARPQPQLRLEHLLVAFLCKNSRNSRSCGRSKMTAAGQKSSRSSGYDFGIKKILSWSFDNFVENRQTKFHILKFRVCLNTH